MKKKKLNTNTQRVHNQQQNTLTFKLLYCTHTKIRKKTTKKLISIKMFINIKTANYSIIDKRTKVK